MTASDSHTLLIVEDDARLRDRLVRAMRDRGYEAVGAADRASALELARQESPELALVDLRLGLVVRPAQPVGGGDAEPRGGVARLALQDLREAEPRLVVVPLAEALVGPLEVPPDVVADLVRRQVLVLRGDGAEEQEDREERAHARIVRASWRRASRVV